MQHKISFIGFKELIESPLEKDDPQSLEFIKAVFMKAPQAPADPFRFLLHQLINKKIKGPEAKEHWQSILHHKAVMEKKLGRRVGIAVAALDYFDTNVDASRPMASPNILFSDQETVEEVASLKESVADICSPGNHIENLKKEMFRAKRYKHSLSVVLLSVDGLPSVDETLSDNKSEEILTVIAKIIKKTIRIVDIFFYCNDSRFLIVLPNTNKREGSELCERIRQNICDRTKLIFSPLTITATISVGQTLANSTSYDFMKQLETTLVEGKNKKCNMVYSF